MTRGALGIAVLVLGLVSCAPASPLRRMAVERESSAIADLRVRSSATNTVVAFEYMASVAAASDMVFFGEQHDDPETHFAEFALLERIGRMNPLVILSLEMFERDVQPMLDAFLAGRMSESEFLAKSRPWDRYATDYRGLVMLARAHGWPVIAANVPRSIASAVGRRGLAALDTLSPAMRAHAARIISCPRNEYYARFAEQMKGHSPGAPAPAASDSAMLAMTNRFYEAQCVKDETMAESIVEALANAGRGAVVVHFNGSFHSDHALGTVERAMRRMPGARKVVVTAVPVAEPSAGQAMDSARADFFIFARKIPK